MSVNSVDWSGRTALHYAAWIDSQVCCRQLLEMGAHVAVGDREGRTPLHLAALAGATFSAKRLLLEGADPRARDSEGHTAQEELSSVSLLACCACLFLFVCLFVLTLPAHTTVQLASDPDVLEALSAKAQELDAAGRPVMEVCSFLC